MKSYRIIHIIYTRATEKRSDGDLMASVYGRTWEEDERAPCSTLSSSTSLTEALKTGIELPTMTDMYYMRVLNMPIPTLSAADIHKQVSSDGLPPEDSSRATNLAFYISDETRANLHWCFDAGRIITEAHETER